MQTDQAITIIDVCETTARRATDPNFNDLHLAAVLLADDESPAFADLGYELMSFVDRNDWDDTDQTVGLDVPQQAEIVSLCARIKATCLLVCPS